MIQKNVSQRGSEDVMNFLAYEARDGNVRSVLFLTPCHATPYYSTLHEKVPMQFLDCSPRWAFQWFIFYNYNFFFIYLRTVTALTFMCCSSTCSQSWEGSPGWIRSVLEEPSCLHVRYGWKLVFTKSHSAIWFRRAEIKGFSFFSFIFRGKLQIQDFISLISRSQLTFISIPIPFNI